MSSKWTINGGITYTIPLNIETENVTVFSENIIKEYPQITEVERSRKDKTLRLFQKGDGQYPLEVMISEDRGIQAAASNLLSVSERYNFIRSVFSKVENLGVSKINIKAIDIRYIFRIKHWGNHNELISKIILDQGMRNVLSYNQDWPIRQTNFDFALNVNNDEDIIFYFSIDPKTSLREIKSGQYDGDSVAIICATARIGGFPRFQTIDSICNELIELWKKQCENVILENVIVPFEKGATPEKPLEKEMDSRE